MVRAQAGDGVAWREILSVLNVRLERYFRRRLGGDGADTEDLIQETLIAVHTRRMTYDASQPFTAWAYAIARYKLIDHLRRRRIRQAVPLEDAGEALWSDSGEAPSTAAADLGRLLGDLPARQEQLVRGVKIEGLSLAEAGERLGMTEGAAKVSLHRALKALMAKVSSRGH